MPTRYLPVFVLCIVATSFVILRLRLSKDTMKVSGIKFELSQEPTLNPSHIPYAKEKQEMMVPKVS